MNNGLHYIGEKIGYCDPIQQAYEDVYKFNKIAGNLDSVTDESIARQLNYITEELDETKEAYFLDDKAELLKETSDLFVTVAGLMLKLGAQGYDVAEALDRVNANNLSKFPTYLTDEDLFSSEREFNYNEEYMCFVLKNKAGKIMKPSDFESVDLSDLVPAGSESM